MLCLFAKKCFLVGYIVKGKKRPSYQTHNSSTLKIEYQHILYVPSAAGNTASYESRATAGICSPQPVSL